MALTVVDHPLAQDLLTRLRDATTLPPAFRSLARRLTTTVALEALRGLPLGEEEVETPLERTTGRLISEDVVAVPILRAGLGMLEAVTDLLPGVSVGSIGLERDEVSLLPTAYYEKLPDLAGRFVLLLDPMLATGGSAARACETLKTREPAQIRFVCVVAAPEGVAKMEQEHPDVAMFTAALDRTLNERGYILPGLGDFGDRLYGTEPGVPGIPGGVGP
jgi:uracil phosphoribosyltransferase